MNEEITLRALEPKEFLLTEKEMLKDPNSYDFVTFLDSNTPYGIIYNNKIVGYYKLRRYIKGNISIDLAIIPEYRGKKIASKVVDMIIEKHGNDYQGAKYFLTTINYKNIKALKSIENTDWIRTTEFDEVMEAEGAEKFIIFAKKNPYHNSLVDPYASMKF